MPRAKRPFNFKRQHRAKVPVPLMAAVQSWLLVRGLHGGPHRMGSSPRPVNYRATGNAGQQAQLMGAQVLQEITNLFNF
jgi:hypothetical protein